MTTPEAPAVADLAQRVGVPVDAVREWQSLGLVDARGGDGASLDDLRRARLVRLLLRRGIDLATIAAAERDGGVLTRHLAPLPSHTQGATYSLVEAAGSVGLPIDVVRRVWQAAELADDPGEVLSDDDLAMLSAIKVVFEASLPEEALLQLVRVYVEALCRVADAEHRLFHFYVHDRLKAEGLSERDLATLDDTVARRVVPLIEPTLLYFHRKGWERAVRDDLVLHVREYGANADHGKVPGRLDVAIAFVDLSAFTALADTMGDQAAVKVLERFGQLVREAVGRFDGRVVKQIGDAFMLVFPDARSAVAGAVAIERLAAREDRFPAVRAGVHAGAVLYREGDYLGTTVNIAARLAAEARPHHVLVTGAVRAAARGLPDVAFVSVGNRRLRGLADEVELFHVPPPAAPRGERATDPMCGMELVAADAPARLVLDGREHVFCSQRCLQRFIEAPERYGVAPAS